MMYTVHEHTMAHQSVVVEAGSNSEDAHPTTETSPARSGARVRADVALPVLTSDG